MRHAPAARHFVLSILLGLAVTLTACSSFQRDWRKAAAQPASNSVAGAWEGRWASEKNGHHGKLACIMTPEPDQRYQARFRATYMNLLHFSYTAEFELQPHDIGWEFDGEADLGKLGGKYFYEGRATTTNIVSTYKSKYDHGYFQLHRPKPRS